MKFSLNYLFIIFSFVFIRSRFTLHKLRRKHFQRAIQVRWLGRFRHRRKAEVLVVVVEALGMGMVLELGLGVVLGVELGAAVVLGVVLVLVAKEPSKRMEPLAKEIE